jgi:MOSC domain-containing protein YiiM
MRVASVNVGIPREVQWGGRKVLTGIFKSPVAAKLPVHRLNIDGDRQADLRVHGGPDKAIYAYASEHYGPWEKQLGRALTPGNFGENLTTEGLLEDGVHIGDEFRVGTARLVITQPRLPCFKLGLRFGDPGMVKSFLKAGSRGSISPSWRRARLAPATRSNASPRTSRGSP